jgi:hypothetical protein
MSTNCDQSFRKFTTAQENRRITMLDGLRKLFANQTPVPPAPPVTTAAILPAVAPPNLGDALLAPGPAVRRAAITLSEPVIVAPAPIVSDPDAERTDLPPRSPAAIQKLIAAGETEESQAKRILNDKLRWKFQQNL